MLHVNLLCRLVKGISQPKNTRVADCSVTVHGTRRNNWAINCVLSRRHDLHGACTGATLPSMIPTSNVVLICMYRETGGCRDRGAQQSSFLFKSPSPSPQNAKTRPTSPPPHLLRVFDPFVPSLEFVSLAGSYNRYLLLWFFIILLDIRSGCLLLITNIPITIDTYTTRYL